MSVKSLTDQVLDTFKKHSNPKQDLINVSNTIQKFNETKAEDLTEQQIIETIDMLGYFHFSIEYILGADISFWRVRSSDPGVLYQSSSDFESPPLEQASGGRANFHNSPLFYAATSPETAFTESRLNEEQFFHLTKYKIMKDRLIPVVVYGDIDSYRRRSKSIFDDENYTKAYKHIFDNLNPDIAQCIYLVDAFFTDRLNRKGCENEYKITRTIFNELFKKDDVCGGIYSSVEHSGGYNYVIKPGFYDLAVLPEETTTCFVFKKYGYGMYQILHFLSANFDSKSRRPIWENIDNYESLLMDPNPIATIYKNM